MDINIQQYRTRIGLFNLCGPKKVKKWRYYQEKIYQKSPNNLFNCTATILIYGLLISDYFLCQNRNLRTDNLKGNLVETLDNLNNNNSVKFEDKSDYILEKRRPGCPTQISDLISPLLATPTGLCWSHLCETNQTCHALLGNRMTRSKGYRLSSWNCAKNWGMGLRIKSNWTERTTTTTDYMTMIKP